ncbi:unnamed protein product [Choristocarpus tenellus]
MLVVDSSNASLVSNTQDVYSVEVVDDGEEMRVTLSWMDPPATVLSAVQLMNDLDLKVTSPSGLVYVMWSSGDADTSNVVERVIVPAADAEVGTWTVTVSAGDLTTESQSYSLVLLGGIASGSSIEGPTFEEPGSITSTGNIWRPMGVVTAASLVSSTMFYYLCSYLL